MITLRRPILSLAGPSAHARALLPLLAVSLAVSACYTGVDHAEPLPSDWVPAAEQATPSVAYGGPLAADIAATLTAQVASRRIGPLAASRLYAYSLLAADRSWDLANESARSKALAARSAAEAAKMMFDDEGVLGELEVMALRHSAGYQGAALVEEARRVAESVLTPGAVDAFIASHMAGEHYPGEGFWDWEPTYPNRLSFLQPLWRTLPTISGAEGCSSPEPRLDILAEEALAMIPSMTPDSLASFRVSLWLSGPGTPTPSGQWLLVASDAASTSGLSERDALSLLASAAVAMYDTSILTWRDKYHHNIARPETMIQRMGYEIPAPPRDTPNHPAYPSGHSSFAGAAAYVISERVGDLPVSILLPPESGHPDGFVRFSSLSEAVNDASMSRVEAGFHFPSDTAAGETLGSCVGAVVEKLAAGGW